MTEITLTKGYVAIVDECDSELNSMAWHAVEDRGRVYASHNAWPRTPSNVSMHRLIMERMLNRKLRAGELVDHEDNNPLNNRRGNLRLASKSQNSHNSKKRVNNKSGYKGVFKGKRGGWMAKIVVNYKPIYLGSFPSPEEAYAAYCKAAKEYHGEFARLD